MNLLVDVLLTLHYWFLENCSELLLAAFYLSLLYMEFRLTLISCWCLWTVVLVLQWVCLLAMLFFLLVCVLYHKLQVYSCILFWLLAFDLFYFRKKETMLHGHCTSRLHTSGGLALFCVYNLHYDDFPRSDCIWFHFGMILLHDYIVSI